MTARFMPPALEALTTSRASGVGLAGAVVYASYDH